MIKNIVIYDKEGCIVSVIKCPEDHIPLYTKNLSYLEGIANDTTQRIVEGKVVDKQKHPINLSKLEVIADGIDSIILSKLPSRCKLCVYGEHTSKKMYVEDGDSLTFDAIGIYKLVVYQPPFLEYEVSVNAV